MITSRGIILKVISSFDKRPGPLDYAIERELSRNPFDHRDRRFIFEIVYGVIRRRLTLDFVLGTFVNDPKVLDNPYIMRILEIGAYQILYMDRVPDHACVNEAVNLAKMNSRTAAAAGLVNATLRTIIKSRKKTALPDPQKDLCRRLSVEYSHPEWMVARWMARLGLSKTKQLLAFNNEKPEVFFRRKLRGLSRPQFETDVHDLCDGAGGYLNLYYRLRKPLQPDTIPLFRDGECTIQAPSSGWVVALLSVEQGDFVADLCCAPGGKSTLIAEMSGTGGMVAACEIRKNRMAAALETFRRMRLTESILPLLCDASMLPFKGTFDKVLLDAPCSGSGVLHRHPEGRWIKKEEDLPRLASLQGNLVESAAAIVRPGGLLVYSTCSIEPEENEIVINRFLAGHKDFVLERPPEAIPAKFIGPDNFLRITPYDHKMDGMFGARLKKIPPSGC
jgi:16S rRNA (cytosine967-C5)-methyltransferase